MNGKRVIIFIFSPSKYGMQPNRAWSGSLGPRFRNHGNGRTPELPEWLLFISGSRKVDFTEDNLYCEDHGDGRCLQTRIGAAEAKCLRNSAEVSGRVCIINLQTFETFFEQLPHSFCKGRSAQQLLFFLSLFSGRRRKKIAMFASFLSCRRSVWYKEISERKSLASNSNLWRIFTARFQPISRSDWSLSRFAVVTAPNVGFWLARVIKLRRIASIISVAKNDPRVNLVLSNISSCFFVCLIN